jgi:hypothetical protein
VSIERDDDPLFDSIDGLSLDHTDLYEEQLPRVIERSHQLKRLEIIEASVRPSFAALFQPPADWSALESLTLDYYYPDDPLVALADLELPSLRELVLRDLWHVKNAKRGSGLATTVLALARAPFWPRLRRLEIDCGSETLLELARHPMTDLEELVLVGFDEHDDDDDPDEQARADRDEIHAQLRSAWYDPTLRPKLRRS